jgi:RNA polymerase sigma-70 factor (ECF subfamily)
MGRDAVVGHQNAAAVDVPALVAAAKRDDEQALDQVLDLYRNYLRLLARTWLNGVARGRAEPSDLVQETMLRAARAFSDFRGTSEEELVAWLRQIMARQLTDLVRRLRAERRNVGREESLHELLPDKLHEMASSSVTGPSHAMRRRELGVVLADALAKLSPARREVIVLRNLEELDWPEVARRMGKSEAAVRKLWARALLALRPLICESI